MDDLLQAHGDGVGELTRIPCVGLAALLGAEARAQQTYVALESDLQRRAFLEALPPAPPDSPWARLLAGKERVVVELKCNILRVKGRAQVVDACRNWLEAHADCAAALLTFVNDGVAATCQAPPARTIVSVATRGSLPPTKSADLSPSTLLVSIMRSVRDMEVNEAAICCTNLQGVLMRQLIGLVGTSVAKFHILYLCPKSESYLDLTRVGDYSVLWPPMQLAADVELHYDAPANRLYSQRGRVFVVLSADAGVHEFVLQRLRRQPVLVGQPVLVAFTVPTRDEAWERAHSLPVPELAKRLGLADLPLCTAPMPVCPRGGIPELRSLLRTHGLLSREPERPVELCRRVLESLPDNMQAQALAVSWLLLHDSWFTQLVHLAVLDFPPWHPDYPAAALAEAVAQVCQRPELTRSAWFRGLRAYAQSCDPAATADVLSRGTKVTVPPPATPSWTLRSLAEVPPAWDGEPELEMHRPHWFVAPEPSVEKLADAVGRRLLGSHQLPVLWHYDAARGVILLGVADDDAALTHNVPCMVNNTPVVLVATTDERTRHLAGERWELPPDDVRALNAAMALGADNFFRNHPHVVGLTGGRAQRDGAVFYDQGPRIIAFVEAECMDKPVCAQLGGFPVDVETAPPRRDRLAVIPRFGPEDENSRGQWHNFVMGQAENGQSELHIGDWICRKGADGHLNVDCHGTLGCFGQLENGQVVALTASHCILGKNNAPVQPNETFVLDYGHKVPQYFWSRVPANIKSAVTAEIAEADAVATHPSFQAADDKHNHEPPEEPMEPPSRMDILDYGYLRILDNAINERDMATPWHWEQVGVTPLAFTGNVAQQAPTPVVHGAEQPGDHALFKFGRTTGLTVGTLCGTYLFTPGNHGARVRFKVRGWSGWTFGKPGDSGSLVIDAHGDAVGIVLQSWPHAALNFEVVAPMQEVMQELGIIRLLPAAEPAS